MPCRQGVLALGDSITNGHGGMQYGLGSQSWAQWLAQAMGLPFTKLAQDGATTTDVLAGQVPAIPDASYDLGVAWIGVNDVRSTEWDPARYERDLARILGTLAGRSERTLTCTIPLRLGMPPAGPKVADANEIVRRVAAAHGTAVCDLGDLAGSRLMWADRVHATALGQVEIADRAARALRAAGAAVPRLPSELVSVAPGPLSRLTYRRHYARRAIYEHARARWIVARHRLTTLRMPGG